MQGEDKYDPQSSRDRRKLANALHKALSGAGFTLIDLPEMVPPR